MIKVRQRISVSELGIYNKDSTLGLAGSSRDRNSEPGHQFRGCRPDAPIHWSLLHAEVWLPSHSLSPGLWDIRLKPEPPTCQRHSCCRVTSWRRQKEDLEVIKKWPFKEMLPSLCLVISQMNLNNSSLKEEK